MQGFRKHVHTILYPEFLCVEPQLKQGSIVLLDHPVPQIPLIVLS